MWISKTHACAGVQTVMVSDTVVPVITAPVAITIEAESSKSTNSTITNNAPEKFILGETVVTWTITDNYIQLLQRRQYMTPTGNRHT